MDKYQALRQIPFTVLCQALGADINKYKTRKNGAEYYGPCLVHQPKANHTSFSYNADGKWNCFSCNAKGRGALDLVKAVKDCGFEAAVAFLEPLVGKEPAKTQKNPPEAVSDASSEVLKPLDPLDKDTWRKFAVACPWLEARVPDQAVRDRYGVYCYNNPARRSAYSGRVMIPVKDLEGKLYGYLGRYIGGILNQNTARESPIQPQPPDDVSDTPKYLFPKALPKSKFLWGAHELTHSATPHSGHLPLKVVYLVESPFCVMKFASLGLPAVSPFGWSVSEQQVQLLETLAKGIVYLPDRNKSADGAGVVHTLAQALWVRFPPLPDDVDDPEYLSKEQILALTR